MTTGTTGQGAPPIGELIAFVRHWRSNMAKLYDYQMFSALLARLERVEASEPPPSPLHAETREDGLRCPDCKRQRRNSGELVCGECRVRSADRAASPAPPASTTSTKA